MADNIHVVHVVSKMVEMQHGQQSKP